MAQLLVVSALSGDDNVIMKALKKLDYYLRRNYEAYKSHRLKKLSLLDELDVIEKYDVPGRQGRISELTGKQKEIYQCLGVEFPT